VRGENEDERLLSVTLLYLMCKDINIHRLVWCRQLPWFCPRTLQPRREPNKCYYYHLLVHWLVWGYLLVLCLLHVLILLKPLRGYLKKDRNSLRMTVSYLKEHGLLQL
jgi:hypothetical protein